MRSCTNTCTYSELEERDIGCELVLSLLNLQGERGAGGGGGVHAGGQR